MTRRESSRSTPTVPLARCWWLGASAQISCARSLRDENAGSGAAMSLLLASIGFGLITSAVLAIASVSFTLQFAVTDVLNLAFAAVVAGGGLTAHPGEPARYSILLGLGAALGAGAGVF